MDTDTLEKTLMAAANSIIESANSLRDCHSVGDQWPALESEVQAIYLRDVALAGRLMRAARYFKVNPLGGPAKTFDAIANAIRAGDGVDHAMRQFGVRWVESNGSGGKTAL